MPSSPWFLAIGPPNSPSLLRGVAEAGEAFALRPVVHVVEELAALLGGARRRDRADDVAASRRSPANRPKPEPLKCSADVA